MIQDTSRTAFVSEIVPTLGTRRSKVLHELKKAYDLTNSELAVRLGWPINTVTPRTNELVKQGLVRIERRRPCEVTVRSAIAWRAVSDTLF